jgi:hypothetical protein
MSKAFDILYEVILSTFVGESHKRFGPGGLITKLPPEKREILKTLSSTELENMRPDACFLRGPVGKGRWGRYRAERKRK